MQVKDAMHSGVYWISPSTTLAEVARLMNDHNVGALPIGEDDRLIGMITERDIVCRGLARGLDLASATAGDVMSRGIFYTNETASLSDAAKIMEANKVRRLPVLNSQKRMTGMLSIGDLSHAGECALCGEVLDAVGAQAA